MKLFFANTSPYARKVRIAVRELNLLDQVAEVFQNPFEDSPALLASNPLKKVPCLLTDAGEPVFDSPVICAYLASRVHAPELYPEGAARWRVLTAEALADGVLDAAFAIVMERRRPEEQRSDTWLTRWRAAIERGLSAIDAEAAPVAGPVNAAQIALGAALGYMDFRLPDIGWREGRPALAAWYESFAQRPAMRETEPPAA